jgi:hypothetical protein
MADLTKTVTSTMTVLGVSQPTLWGNFEWGAEEWGATGDLCKAFDKAPLTNTLTMTENNGRDFNKAALTESINLTDDLNPVEKSWDGDLWKYIFTKSTTDGTEKVFDQFTKVTDQDDDFSEVSGNSTSWTGV